MKYNIESIVTIRRDLKKDACFCGEEITAICAVTAEMTKFNGKEATITDIMPNGFFKIDIDNGRWSWSTDMFAPKWDFNLEQFKKENIAVHCITRASAKLLLDTLADAGIVWGSKDLKTDSLRYNVFGTNTCYEIYGGLAYCDVKYFNSKDYKIYDFADITFPKSKESAAKHKIITTSELKVRGLKTGDVVITKDKGLGIIINDWISYVNEVAWDDKSIENIKQIILVESIKSTDRVPLLISMLLKSRGKIDSELEQYILDVEKSESPKLPRKVYQVQFTPKGMVYDFLSHDDTLAVDDFVECNGNNHNRKYAKIRNIKIELLTEREVSCLYKYCRKG